MLDRQWLILLCDQRRQVIDYRRWMLFPMPWWNLTCFIHLLIWILCCIIKYFNKEQTALHCTALHSVWFYLYILSYFTWNDHISFLSSFFLSFSLSLFLPFFFQHRMDPATPLEETMTCLKSLVQSGQVKYIGLSECTPDEMRRAHAISPLSAIQMEYSLQSR